MHRLTLQASTQVPPQHQPKIRQDHKEEGPPELQAAALGGKSLKLAWNFTFTCADPALLPAACNRRSLGL